MIRIGATVSNKAPDMLYGSVLECLSYNANALMFYLGAPQSTLRQPFEKLQSEKAFKLLQEHNIPIENVIVHAPYIVNLANPNLEKREFSISFLTRELTNVALISAKYMVLHPGCHVGQGVDIAIKYIAEGINKILSDENTKDTVILLETMAGKGTEIGRNFQELKAIIDLVDQKSRVKICLDTCHINDAGYDIVHQYDKVFEEFDKILGLENIKAIHLNDSKNIVGASKDRHENIGFGTIGFDTLNKVAHDERFKDIPKILETPFIEKNSKSFPLYKEEIVMLRNNTFNPLLKE